MSSRILLVAASLLLVACASAAQTSPATTPKPTATPSADFEVGGDRPVTVHVPTVFDPTVPSPVLILLHGFGSNGEEQEGYWRLGPLAAERGMLYIRPNGSINTRGERFWNATDACCDLNGSGVDDSGYLAGLIAEIGQRVAVDPRQVFVVGHSNGGFMSYRFACDHADLVAAMVSVAGASYADPAACEPSEPVTVVQIHGSLDDVVRVEGGNAEGVLDAGDRHLADYPSVVASLTSWAEDNGCTGQLEPGDETYDLEGTLELRGGPNETVVSAFEGCPASGAVERWLIEGGSHIPDWSEDFAPTVIDLLLAHPKAG